ncbi:MAG: hypothetical protein ACI8QD_001740 [Cyclobacteriaceae bacterium]|jgi:hypothetical protein
MHRLFILTLFISMACSSREEVPSDIYSSTKMVAILLDVHLLEEKLEVMGMPYDSQLIMYDHFERLIFEKHAIDSSAYSQSFNYYIEHPGLIETIYEGVVDSLLVKEKTQSID